MGLVLCLGLNLHLVQLRSVFKMVCNKIFGHLVEIIRECYIIITNLAISSVLTHISVAIRSKKFGFVYQTEAHVVWA